MGPIIYNDYRQQPISSDQACGQYRHYLAQLETMIADQEDIIIRARAEEDYNELARARTSLWRLLTKRQGVIDAISAYEQQQANG
jgi:hypothetical protein